MAVIHGIGTVTEVRKRINKAHATVSEHLDNLENEGFLKSQKKGRKRIYTVNWSVVLSAIMKLQREWLWEFQRYTYELFKEGISQSQLNEITKNMVNNRYLKHLYETYLSIYFETSQHLVELSIYELLVSKFFDDVLPRYYDLFEENAPTREESDEEFNDFREFLRLSYEICSTVHTLWGSAFRDAIIFSFKEKSG